MPGAILWITDFGSGGIFVKEDTGKRPVGIIAAG